MRKAKKKNNKRDLYRRLLVLTINLPDLWRHFRNTRNRCGATTTVFLVSDFVQPYGHFVSLFVPFFGQKQGTIRGIIVT